MADRPTLTETDQESLIEAIQAGTQDTWVEAWAASRAAEAVRSAAGRVRDQIKSGNTAPYHTLRMLENLANEYDPTAEVPPPRADQAVPVGIGHHAILGCEELDYPQDDPTRGTPT